MLAQKWRVNLLLFILLHFFLNESLAQTRTIPRVLDATLTAYNYPYPVKYLSLKNEDVTSRLAYMDVAAGNSSSDGPVVVLLHGKNFFGAYWQQTISFLNKMGYRVVVPDQIGFGKSSKPSLHYSFHQLAANTKKLLDTLGVAKAVVVGHSMGGMLATRLALM